MNLVLVAISIALFAECNAFSFGRRISGIRVRYGDGIGDRSDAFGEYGFGGGVTGGNGGEITGGYIDVGEGFPRIVGLLDYILKEMNGGGIGGGAVSSGGSGFRKKLSGGTGGEITGVGIGGGAGASKIVGLQGLVLGSILGGGGSTGGIKVGIVTGNAGRAGVSGRSGFGKEIERTIGELSGLEELVSRLFREDEGSPFSNAYLNICEYKKIPVHRDSPMEIGDGISDGIKSGIGVDIAGASGGARFGRLFVSGTRGGITGGGIGVGAGASGESRYGKGLAGGIGRGKTVGYINLGASASGEAGLEGQGSGHNKGGRGRTGGSKGGIGGMAGREGASRGSGFENEIEDGIGRTTAGSIGDRADAPGGAGLEELLSSLIKEVFSRGEIIGRRKGGIGADIAGGTSASGGPGFEKEFAIAVKGGNTGGYIGGGVSTGKNKGLNGAVTAGGTGASGGSGFEKEFEGGNGEGITGGSIGDRAGTSGGAGFEELASSLVKEGGRIIERIEDAIGAGITGGANTSGGSGPRKGFVIVIKGGDIGGREGSAGRAKHRELVSDHIKGGGIGAGIAGGVSASGGSGFGKEHAVAVKGGNVGGDIGGGAGASEGTELEELVSDHIQGGGGKTGGIQSGIGSVIAGGSNAAGGAGFERLVDGVTGGGKIGGGISGGTGLSGGAGNEELVSGQIKGGRGFTGGIKGGIGAGIAGGTSGTRGSGFGKEYAVAMNGGNTGVAIGSGEGASGGAGHEKLVSDHIQEGGLSTGGIQRRIGTVITGGSSDSGGAGFERLVEGVVGGGKTGGDISGGTGISGGAGNEDLVSGHNKGGVRISSGIKNGIGVGIAGGVGASGGSGKEFADDIGEEKTKDCICGLVDASGGAGLQGPVSAHIIGEGGVTNGIKGGIGADIAGGQLASGRDRFGRLFADGIGEGMTGGDIGVGAGASGGAGFGEGIGRGIGRGITAGGIGVNAGASGKAGIGGGDADDILRKLAGVAIGDRAGAYGGAGHKGPSSGHIGRGMTGGNVVESRYFVRPKAVSWSF